MNSIHQLPPKLISPVNIHETTYKCSPPPFTPLLHFPPPLSLHPTSHQSQKVSQMAKSSDGQGENSCESCLSELKPNNCSQPTTNYMQSIIHRFLSSSVADERQPIPTQFCYLQQKSKSRNGEVTTWVENLS